MDGPTPTYRSRFDPGSLPDSLVPVDGSTARILEEFKASLSLVLQDRTYLLIDCVGKIRGQNPDILTDRVCGPATKFLRYILERAGYTVDRLDSKNAHDHYPALDHAILMVRAPTGDPIIVDPSYQQFVRRLHNWKEASTECRAVYDQFPRILMIEPGGAIEAGRLLMKLWQQVETHLCGEGGVLGFEVDDREINLRSFTVEEGVRYFAGIWELSHYEPSRFRRMEDEIEKLRNGTLERPYSVAFAEILELLDRSGVVSAASVMR